MLIHLRDKENKLVIKDVLDIDFDMSVELSNNGKYCVNVNNIYHFDEEFNSQDEAEEKMVHIANVRNHLESELSNY